MATDLKTIMDDNTALTMISEYMEFQPPHTVNYGRVYQESNSDLEAKTGFTHEYTGPFGGDLYICWAIAVPTSTVLAKDRIYGIISDTIEICDSLFTGNNEYEKLYAEVDDIVWDGNRNWKVAKFRIFCTKNNKALY